jgi:hypothetical protein
MKKSFQRLKYLRLLRAYFIRAMVCTDDGTTCRAKISKELEKELIEVVKGIAV